MAHGCKKVRHSCPRPFTQLWTVRLRTQEIRTNVRRRSLASLPNGNIHVTVGESWRKKKKPLKNKEGEKKVNPFGKVGKQWVDSSNVPQWRAMNLGKTESVTRKADWIITAVYMLTHSNSCM